MHQDFMRFHQQYGDTVRIKSDEISYANAQAWKDIHAHVPGRPELLKDPVRLPRAPQRHHEHPRGGHAQPRDVRQPVRPCLSDKGLRVQEAKHPPLRRPAETTS
ncbi:hypothetical protein C8A03DRAFT_39766, partial [Achaetomium macrosporum]